MTSEIVDHTVRYKGHSETYLSSSSLDFDILELRGQAIVYITNLEGSQPYTNARRKALILDLGVSSFGSDDGISQ